MRLLDWDKVHRELDSNAAFNMALLRAIDPRIITHRPRDPEKKKLMEELGMESRHEAIVKAVGANCKPSTGKKTQKKSIVNVDFE